ncbi:chemotaxis protein CheB [Deltaproteobacteria bacterium TL4]
MATRKKRTDAPQKEIEKDAPVPTKPMEGILPSVEKKAEMFYVVGLAASAGGLEAFENFFTHMPPENGMAFVVVSHLDPNHTSIIHSKIHPHAGFSN